MADHVGALDDILERVTALDRDDRNTLVEGTLGLVDDAWVPNPGPQMDAFFSQADELGYGGEAGGGKSDLVIGKSLTQHHRSLVLRRTNKEAGRFANRYAEIIGHRIGLNSTKGTWQLGERFIEYGGCQTENDKQKYKGDPHDLVAFDEVVDFTETQYTFITTWCRTTRPRQRCQIVATFNPPTSPIGMWVVKRWGPWLDENHPNPARDGELRWYVRTVDDEDIEVHGPGDHEVNGTTYTARSRTFIRARLSDNPDLNLTDDYRVHLQNLPRELREAFAEGKFSASLRDRPFQMVPTDWVRRAMQCRKQNLRPPIPMCCIGVDASGGGDDPMLMAPRYDGWFEDLIEVPGREIPPDRQGTYPAGLVIAVRRDRCIIVVDCGGGYGNAMHEHLKLNGVDVRAHKGSFSSTRRTRDGQLAFGNKRAEVGWKFREALDPEQRGGSPIMLPEDMELLADLTAPTFMVQGERGIVREPKEKVTERLGRSTNRGDAVEMSWSEGPTNVASGAGEWFDAHEQGLPGIGQYRQRQAVMGRGQDGRPRR